LTRYFCPECGSPLYTVSPVHPDVLYLKAGTLDDPRLVQPRHQNWIAIKGLVDNDRPRTSQLSQKSGRSGLNWQQSPSLPRSGLVQMALSLHRSDRPKCRLLAQSGHASEVIQRLLLGVKRTWRKT
jgi:hypothetical protein